MMRIRERRTSPSSHPRTSRTTLWLRFVRVADDMRQVIDPAAFDDQTVDFAGHARQEIGLGVGGPELLMPKQQDLDVLGYLRACQQHQPVGEATSDQIPIRNPTGVIRPSGLSGPNVQDTPLRRESGAPLRHDVRNSQRLDHDDASGPGGRVGSSARLKVSSRQAPRLRSHHHAASGIAMHLGQLVVIGR
jgi:hypothetical protein